MCMKLYYLIKFTRVEYWMTIGNYIHSLQSNSYIFYLLIHNKLSLIEYLRQSLNFEYIIDFFIF